MINDIIKDHNPSDFVIINSNNCFDEFNFNYKIIYIREDKKDYNDIISKLNGYAISDKVYKQEISRGNLDNKITVLNYKIDKVIDKIIKNNAHVIILLCYDHNYINNFVDTLLKYKNVDILMKISKNEGLHNNYRRYYFTNYDLLYIYNKDNISYINELYHSKYKYDLIKMFQILLRKTDIKILNKKLTDYEYYKLLKKDYINQKNYYSSEINYKRAYSRWHVFKKYIKTKINSYIDFGGGNGDMAFTIGRRLLHLDKSNVFVVDKEAFLATKWKPRDDITFYNDLDSINKKVDLITAFHVLHHIENIDIYSDKIINKLNDNGYFILFEHNITDRLLFNLVDIQHQIYEIVLGNTTYEDYFKYSYSNYKSSQQWIKLFNKLKLIDVIDLNKYDKTNCFIFRKII